jgi:hypothetical protein
MVLVHWQTLVTAAAFVQGKSESGPAPTVIEYFLFVDSDFDFDFPLWRLVFGMMMMMYFV